MAGVERRRRVAVVESCVHMLAGGMALGGGRLRCCERNAKKFRQGIVEKNR